MTTEAEAVAELARQAKLEGHTVVTLDDREFLIVPAGFASQDVTPAHKLAIHVPDHIRQSVMLQTTDSLVEYCNLYKGENTLLFADIASNTIACQIDYHQPNSEAAFVAHRATLALNHSTEWLDWSRISGKLMEQLDFARFIEENVADVRAPTGADLLECIRDI